ncbi:serine hydrolase [Streptomyces sp. NPDC127117]|uniref:serine hydrolase n=1 Tax=Streptomyces sp. NPDC127117 TaxID=3345368 RepID=UPI0036260B23
MSASPYEEFPPLTPAVAGQPDGAVRQIMRDARVPGVTVGPWVPEKRSCVRASGVAGKSSGTPMPTGLDMRVGGMTKTFTATALLTPAGQGKVRPDDPIAKYVKGDPDGDRITLREPAGMLSGLFDYSVDPDFSKALTSDPQRPFTPPEARSPTGATCGPGRGCRPPALCSARPPGPSGCGRNPAVPDTGYDPGIFNAHGWTGHNGSLPGYEALVVRPPGPKATLVVLLNTDTDHRGSEPSTLFGEAVTRIVTPRHACSLPARPAAK